MKVTQVGTREIRGMVLLGDVYAVLVGGFLKKTNTKFTYGCRGIEVVDGVWKIEDVVTNSNIDSYLACFCLLGKYVYTKFYGMPSFVQSICYLTLLILVRIYLFANEL